MLLTVPDIDIRHKGQHQLNALHFAACHGHINVIQQLLQKDPDIVNVPDSMNRTPIFSAICAQKKKVVAHLVSNSKVDLSGRTRKAIPPSYMLPSKIVP